MYFKTLLINRSMIYQTHRLLIGRPQLAIAHNLRKAYLHLGLIYLASYKSTKLAKPRLLVGAR